MSWFLSKNYPIHLLIIVLVVLAFSAINVPHPDDFKLEHYMTVVFIVLLIATYHRFRLSNVSYTLIFLFLLLHILGAHYTYSEVPYNRLFQDWLGFDVDQYFGFSRNMYDRLVHFSFGLLFFYPVRELFARVADTRGWWNLYLPLDVMMAFSMLYELIEWGVAIFYGGSGVDMTYIGSQGDVWDAQKDMALATLGAIISLIVVLMINLKLNSHFWQELKESLRIKRASPLGEIAIESWLNKKE